MMKLGNQIILDTYWFKNAGVVLLQDHITREYKFYIKGGLNGASEEVDTLEIVKFGSKFPEDAGKALFKDFDFDEDWINDHPEYFI